MDRKAILKQAEQCVCGQRETDYGRPEDNFGRIALMWSAYTGCTITAQDVAMMMALLKIARIRNGGTVDSFVDLAGYAACGGEIFGGGASDLVGSASTEATEPAPSPEPAKPKRKKSVKGKANDGGRPLKRGKNLDVPKMVALKKAGWSYDKIADEMSCSAGTVYKYVLEALKKEKAQAEQEEPSKRGALDRREALEVAYCLLTAAVNDSDISNLPPSLTHAYGKLTTAFHDCMLCEDAVIG